MAAKIKHIPYRSLSASPTLTNPDMILPDYDYNQSSSPDAEVLPPTMWKNNLTSNFVAGPATPTTPIIYGNGTMLSDIGEVTEVESTIENPSIETTGSISIESTENLGRLKFSSSYTGGTTTNLESVKSDRLTSETSPAMTNERNAISVNFHDSISSEDSNFQGDDEESLTSSYHSKVDTILEDTETYNIQSNSRVVSEIKFSTTSLGKRAEEILANAKQRLNEMEGNLSRARSINSIHPLPSAPGATTDSFTPPLSLHSVATHKEISSVEPQPQGHTRLISETNVPLTSERQRSMCPRRSASASGIVGRRQSSYASKKSFSFDHIGEADRDNYMRDSLSGGFKNANIKPIESALLSLAEDGVSTAHAFEDPMGNESSARLERFLSPTFGSFRLDSRSEFPPRAASAAQVRDLKDQMKGLKGKISILREQARIDSMKRRSLQNIRTPSPFTHAQLSQWCTTPQSVGCSAIGTSKDSRGTTSDIESQKSDRTKYDSPESLSDSSELQGGLGLPKFAIGHSGGLSCQVPGQGKINSLNPTVEKRTGTPRNFDKMQIENGNEAHCSQPDEHVSIYESESGDSIYHDTVPQQISHEDREDAFDYGHFFLHSAMGTLGQTRPGRRESTRSLSSVDSAETTKGPSTIITTKSLRSAIDPNQALTRSDSIISTSTIDSFATATENQYSTVCDDAIANDRELLSVMTASAVHQQPSAVTTRRNTSLPTGVDNNIFIHPACHQRLQHNMFCCLSMNQTTHMPRASLSSFESTGTMRIFPLINRPKSSPIEVLTSRVSPDKDFTVNNFLFTDAKVYGANAFAPINFLRQEDHILVQKLLDSLGKCIFRLADHRRANSERRMYRRRLEIARSTLEVLDEELT